MNYAIAAGEPCGDTAATVSITVSLNNFMTNETSPILRSDATFF